MDLGSGSPGLMEVVGNRRQLDRMGRWGGDVDAGVEMGVEGTRGAEVGAGSVGSFAGRGEDLATMDRSLAPEAAASVDPAVTGEGRGFATAVMEMEEEGGKLQLHYWRRLPDGPPHLLAHRRPPGRSRGSGACPPT